jgi:diphthamide synthase (EF-2-diphthine--ammonia ligase)
VVSEVPPGKEVKRLLKGWGDNYLDNYRELAHSFIKAEFKAVTTCVDTKVLGRKFVGREIDEAFLSELPPNVDPCGENGEYHSFVYDGPIFKKRVPFSHGERILREERFYYCDLVADEEQGQYQERAV